MTSPQISHSRSWRTWVPFGLGQIKPRHFRDMLKVVWENRDNLPYAWRILTRGVCDGCALGVAGLHDWTIDGVHLCMTRLNLLRLNTMPAVDERILADAAGLAMLDNQHLRQLGRLAFPMLRERGNTGFRRISWEAAYERIAKRLRATDPRRVAFFLTARGVTNEVYYMAQKAARFLGTNHIDNAARLCHSPSSAAMKSMLGVAASTCSYRDWFGTDLVIFFGSNPANDQPVSTKYLHEAKRLGTKIVLVNPLLEPGMKKYWVPSSASSALFGSDLADYWFAVSQGGDIAFLNGTLKVLFENDWVDPAFIGAHTAGVEALRAHLQLLPWPELEQQSGLSQAEMRAFAQLLHDAKNAVLVWSMGITQHPFGAQAVENILNLALSQGWIGRDKCGVMPIRGHSSVQGGAEMGAYASALPGAKPLTPENLAALGAEYGFPIPDWPGMQTTAMIDACANGNLDVLYCLGGNLLRTLPQPDSVAKALSQVPLRIHQDILLTDQMFLEPGEEVLLLPAKTRYEQDDGGTETSTERRVMFSPELARPDGPIGEARAEWKILRDLAAATYPDRAHLLGCATGDAMRQEIARVVPFYDGIQHLKKTGDAFQYGGPHLCPNGQFATSDGKGHFQPVPLPAARPPGLFHVSTRRGKQFNTLIYAQIDPLTGADRDAVFMSAADARRLQLEQGDPVTLFNALGRFEGRVFLAEIAPGNLQIHWPEANILISRERLDPQSGIPDYNALVEIEKTRLRPARLS